jgi:hypothetical protein
MHSYLDVLNIDYLPCLQLLAKSPALVNMTKTFGLGFDIDSSRRCSWEFSSPALRALYKPYCFSKGNFNNLPTGMSHLTRFNLLETGVVFLSFVLPGTDIVLDIY